MSDENREPTTWRDEVPGILALTVIVVGLMVLVYGAVQ